MSIFQGDIFGGMGGLGVLPEGALPIGSLAPKFGTRFGFDQSRVQSEIARGAAYYTYEEAPGGLRFRFFREDGTATGTAWALTDRPASVSPDLTLDERPPLAPREGDGLLTSAAPRRSNWLPWALVGGGVLVAGGVIFAVTRRPAVAANRRRRRRRRRTRR